MIARNFPKKRGDAVVDYWFRTFDGLEKFEREDGTRGRLCCFLGFVLETGIPLTFIAGDSVGVTELPLLVCSSERRDDPICEIARRANASGNGNRQHDILQKYFLENDEFTIAAECPVWDLEKNILGHIDLIRLVGDKVELWDYKPNAHREKKAASQILRYRNLLAKNTSIPIANIQAGYFDEKDAYFLKF